jgi:hypothetical protein
VCLGGAKLKLYSCFILFFRLQLLFTPIPVCLYIDFVVHRNTLWQHADIIVKPWSILNLSWGVAAALVTVGLIVIVDISLILYYFCWILLLLLLQRLPLLYMCLLFVLAAAVVFDAKKENDSILLCFYLGFANVLCVHQREGHH